jgi:ferrochelatase
MSERTSLKLAVVLFNLGGPTSPDSVKPFLFNLFNDPSILRVRNPMRWLLAKFISGRRAKEAGEIYAKLGGKSPLLENTRVQAAALETALADEGEVRVFIAMRYWHPMSRETAEAVKAFGPDQIVLLPLYPQFSTTTSASSYRVWNQAAEAVGLDVPATLVCCYPLEPGFIQSAAGLVREAYRRAVDYGAPRVLFSAHGLPETIVRAGDPYQWQCERTVEALVAALDLPDLDWVGCYQSRVGPLKWIEPATEDEVRRAAAERRPLIVVPIAFVSEHSETLVEIGMEYRELALDNGVPFFASVPTVADAPPFIAGLARLVRDAARRPPGICSAQGDRYCPSGFAGCPIQAPGEGA